METSFYLRNNIYAILIVAIYLVLASCCMVYMLSRVLKAKYEKEKKRSLLRRIGSKVSFAMSHYLINMPKDIELNSYYGMKRFVVNEIIKYKNSYPFVHGLALRVTRNIARTVGTSNYTFKSLLKLWLNGFTAFSEKPLRLAAVTGIICSMLGIVSAIVIIIQRLTGHIQSMGYASMMAALLLFSGIIMMFLGLLGEYIGRMYICINNAPQYAIRETQNIESLIEEYQPSGKEKNIGA